MKQRHLYLGVILLMLVQGAQAQPATPDSTGYLRLVVHLDSVFVYFNDDYHNYQRIDSVAVLELPAREHKITLASARAYDYEFYQAITPGDTATYSVRLSTRINPKAFYRYSSYPVLRTNATLMVFTDEDSEIFIDGQAAGRGMVKKDLEPGAYTVETRHPRAGDKKQAGAHRSQPAPPGHRGVIQPSDERPVARAGDSARRQSVLQETGDKGRAVYRRHRRRCGGGLPQASILCGRK